MENTIIALIKEYNGGRYGTMGVSVARVEPTFFKNGKIKKMHFHIVEELKTLKKGYGYGNCVHTEVIDRILSEEDLQKVNEFNYDRVGKISSWMTREELFPSNKADTGTK